MRATSCSSDSTCERACKCCVVARCVHGVSTGRAPVRCAVRASRRLRAATRGPLRQRPESASPGACVRGGGVGGRGSGRGAVRARQLTRARRVCPAVRENGVSSEEEDGGEGAPRRAQAQRAAAAARAPRGAAGAALTGAGLRALFRARARPCLSPWTAPSRCAAAPEMHRARLLAGVAPARAPSRGAAGAHLRRAGPPACAARVCADPRAGWPPRQLPRPPAAATAAPRRPRARRAAARRRREPAGRGPGAGLPTQP
jgi:hypothetical protein